MNMFHNHMTYKIDRTIDSYGNKILNPRKARIFLPLLYYKIFEILPLLCCICTINTNSYD